MKDHSIFCYSYIDHTGFQVFNDLLLEGEFSDTDVFDIKQHTENDYFSAEKIGIPPISHKLWDFSGGVAQEDIYLHKFIGFFKADKEVVEALYPPFSSVENILAAFEESGGSFSNCNSIDDYIFARRYITKEEWRSNKYRGLFILNKRMNISMTEKPTSKISKNPVRFTSIDKTASDSFTHPKTYPSSIDVEIQEGKWLKMLQSINSIQFSHSTIEIHDDRDSTFTAKNESNTEIDLYDDFDDPLEFRCYRLDKTSSGEPIIYLVLQAKYHDTFITYELRKTEQAN